MLPPEDVEWLQVALKEIDNLLRGLADFRPYSDLLSREDARLQTLLDHVVTTVRDARLLNTKAITRLDQAHQAALEEVKLAAETAARPPEPAPVVPPPAAGASAVADGPDHDGQSHGHARAAARRRP